ncbi:MAG: hypothetical protein ACW99G_12940 [Candidatus Thorarchaeota archaeon]
MDVRTKLNWASLASKRELLERYGFATYDSELEETIDEAIIQCLESGDFEESELDELPTG